MKKIKSLTKLTFLVLVLAPLATLANGGVWIWPQEIRVDQTDQNAIIAWDGQNEILTLSTNWKKSTDNQTATLLKVVPLPTEPSEIKEGEAEIFTKLVKILNEKIKIVQRPTDGEQSLKIADDQIEGVEIVSHKIIGAHDVTVVKVSKSEDFSNWIDNFATNKKLGKRQISDEFKTGLKNYLKRDINYFVFDLVELNEAKVSIKPLVYKFKSDYLYFPMLVSGISEIGNSRTNINLFLVFDDNMTLPKQIWQGGHSYYWVNDDGSDIELTGSELKKVSEDLTTLLDGNVFVRTLKISGVLSKIDKDLMVFPQILQNNLKIGMKNNDVRILQQMLINEGFWESDLGVTGYFGPTTQKAVMKFQSKYKTQILEPLGLSTPTGFFGPYTRKYLNENIFIKVK